MYIVGFGLDKLQEQKDLKTLKEENIEAALPRFVENMDVIEILPDLVFHKEFISNRLAEVQQFNKNTIDK